MLLCSLLKIFQTLHFSDDIQAYMTNCEIFFMLLGVDMQASNDLVHRLGGTCQAQLQAVNHLRQDMASSQASHHERHDQQTEALHSMVCTVHTRTLCSFLL